MKCHSTNLQSILEKFFTTSNFKYFTYIFKCLPHLCASIDHKLYTPAILKKLRDF